MKIAVSIPDGVFRDAERVAKRLKKSRSALYAVALSEYVRQHDPDAVTEAMNRAVDDGMEAEWANFRQAAARRVFARNKW